MTAVDGTALDSVREDAKATCHFDTNHYLLTAWKDPADLQDQLYSRLVATLGRAGEG